MIGALLFYTLVFIICALVTYNVSHYSFNATRLQSFIWVVLVGSAVCALIYITIENWA